MKTFKELREEQINNAKKTLETIEKIKELGPLTSEIREHAIQAKEILENPNEITMTKVENIATMVANIKEIGMSPKDVTVEEWSKKELGLDANGLSEILEDNSTPDEVKDAVLENMNVPKEMIDTKQNQTISPRQK